MPWKIQIKSPSRTQGKFVPEQNNKDNVLILHSVGQDLLAAYFNIGVFLRVDVSLAVTQTHCMHSKLLYQSYHCSRTQGSWETNVKIKLMLLVPQVIKSTFSHP